MENTRSDAWLNIYGVAADVRSLAAWRELWARGEAGSREEPVSPPGRGADALPAGSRPNNRQHQTPEAP